MSRNAYCAKILTDAVKDGLQFVTETRRVSSLQAFSDEVAEAELPSRAPKMNLWTPAEFEKLLTAAPSKGRYKLVPVLVLGGNFR